MGRTKHNYGCIFLFFYGCFRKPRKACKYIFVLPELQTMKSNSGIVCELYCKARLVQQAGIVQACNKSAKD